jgi:hypothetical protein
MNLIEEFKKGQRGSNKGLYMGEGLDNISSYINGIQQGRMYAIAAPPKVGKSTLTDYGFLISPYLDSLKNSVELEIIYYSFELNRVSKEFDVATYFINHDFGIEKVYLEPGVTKNGKSEMDLSPNYLRGRILDDNGETIKVSPEVLTALQTVYKNRIIPMFGEYSADGKKLSKGIIHFIENKDNPTGLFKSLKEYASLHGKFVKEGKPGYERVTGYRANNPNRYVIIIIDHVRKLILERGFAMKQNIDKFSEYMCELRDLCNFTFVPIIHTNRNLASTDRIKVAGQDLYPQSEDVKDSG